MNNLFKISEATSLAMHTLALMAGEPEKIISVKESASFLNVSEAHLAKVLQRLSHAGYVNSTRGPKGGFLLMKSPDEVTLLDIYELIEGKIDDRDCLLDHPICTNGNCLFGDSLRKMNREIKEHLSKTTLSEVKIFLGGKNNGEKRDN
jgi:Rrf2 family protein